MNYKESIDWLDSFQQFGIKLGLERIGLLCDKLGNPQDNYKIIHVGGTNGKGSICRFLGSILTSAGYKTGVYTSPHLQRITERFVIGDKEILEEEFIALVEKVKPLVEEIKTDGESPTYFEIVTAMAFQYFREKNVDFAVIEVGLGGRFDATNIVNPILTVITNVSLEHQNVLGNNIEDIAFEKAGIIRKDVPIITGAEGDALKIIQKKAKENNSEIFIVKDGIWERIFNDLNWQEFLIEGSLKEYAVKTKMLGEFQGKNIATSIASIENLQFNGIYIPEESIFEGIEKTIFSGRMEIIQKNPIIIMDGAHNIAGIEVLTETLKNDFTYSRLILVMGILVDKKISEMVKIITPLVDIVVVTKSTNERACNPLKLKKIIEGFGFKKKIVVKEKINDAIEFAKSIANKDDLICITGSLFTVGEAKDLLI